VENVFTYGHVGDSGLVRRMTDFRPTITARSPQLVAVVLMLSVGFGRIALGSTGSCQFLPPELGS
jgi:hypothetical protein